MYNYIQNGHTFDLARGTLPVEGLLPGGDGWGGAEEAAGGHSLLVLLLVPLNVGEVGLFVVGQVTFSSG